jgi:hypothetical protein
VEGTQRSLFHTTAEHCCFLDLWENKIVLLVIAEKPFGAREQHGNFGVCGMPQISCTAIN